MKKWWWGGIVTLLILMAGSGGYVWQNRQNWVRAQAKIEQLPEDKQAEAWRELEGDWPGEMYGGILAGSAFERIWVWGREGLKSFVVDEHSVYSWYDGCNEEVLEELSAGVAGAIARYVTADMTDWRGWAVTGDYVRVYVTLPGAGGNPGNIREIYTYNFWLFMPTGMEERCAK
jgi:hypothetical protein